MEIHFFQTTNHLKNDTWHKFYGSIVSPCFSPWWGISKGPRDPTTALDEVLSLVNLDAKTLGQAEEHR